MHVEFDDMRGEVRAGGVTALCKPVGQCGELRLGGEDGPVVRPVTFAERSVAAGEALRSVRRRASLCGALRARAMLRTGASEVVPGELVDCVVLALAGSEEPAPSFADTALSVMRASGGELSSLLDAPAREVDRLSIALLGEPEEGSDDGWTRVVLAEAALSLAAVRDRLADMLLFRAAAPAGAGRARPTTAPQHADGALTARPDRRHDAAGSAAADPEQARDPLASAPEPRALGQTRVWSAERVVEPHDRRVPSPRARMVEQAPPGPTGKPGFTSHAREQPAASQRLLGTPAEQERHGDRTIHPPEATRQTPLASDGGVDGTAQAASPDPTTGSLTLAQALNLGGDTGAAPALHYALAARDRDDAVGLDLADVLAAVLQDEADLRGLDR